MSPTTKPEMDAAICAAVWSSRGAQKWMNTLSYDVGPRPPGSPAMRKASEVVQQSLVSSGSLNVHTERVPVLTWNPKPSRLELVSPHRRKYECVQHVHSASADVSGPLVDGGSEDHFSGAIALMRGHENSGSGRFTPLQIRVEELRRRGVQAILVQNTVPGTGPAIELMGIDADIPVPVLGVSWEDAEELTSFGHAGNALIRVQTTGSSTPGECVNTIADLGPEDDDAEMILLSAHMDTFHVNPGSFDNLTGVVTLLEIAGALAPFQRQFVRRLRLIIYTGEEYGFIGSRAYVSAHSEELDRIRFVFNLDSLWPATADAIAVMGSPEMKDYVERVIKDIGRPADIRNLICISSDYLPFLLEGISCARPAGFEAAFPPYSHTRMDTADKVPGDWIRLNAMNHGRLLARMLTDPGPLPGRRKTALEIGAMLDREQARELLRIYGFPV